MNWKYFPSIKSKLFILPEQLWRFPCGCHNIPDTPRSRQRSFLKILFFWFHSLILKIYLDITTPLTPVLEIIQHQIESQDYHGYTEETGLSLDDDQLEKRASLIYSRRNRLTRSKPSRKALRKRPRRFSKCKFFSAKIVPKSPKKIKRL